MLRDDPHACNLVEFGDRQLLHQTVVLDVPQVDHALHVTSEEAVKLWRAVDANERVLVAFQLHDRLLLERVPN